MSAQIKTTTQDHLDILDIKDNFVVLKNGSVGAVLLTNAVNFDLLSEVEQDALISAFSMLLNSITFPLQVMMRSRKLDISKYVDKVRRVEAKINEPLMKHQAQAYRKFVQDVIKTNEVLDKRFFVVVSTNVGGGLSFEGSSGPFDWVTQLFGAKNKRVNVNVERAVKDAKVHLIPKAEHVVKEFNRLGVRARMLNTQELVELYFDFYNPTTTQGLRIRTSVEDYKSAIVNPAILEE
jgi:hypothetical protein